MRWNEVSRCKYHGKSIETETTTWSEFPNGGKAIVEKILASEERNTSKKAGLWESRIEINIFEILNVPNFNKYWALLILGLIWA